MVVPNLHTRQFSQRQICQAMDFSESTVKSWSRKGFRLVGQGGSGEIKTSRGQPNSLSGNNAMELMLTIHLVGHGIDPVKAHDAAVRFAHFGIVGSSGSPGDQKEYGREPGQLYPNSGVGTLLVLALGEGHNQCAVVPFKPGEVNSDFNELAYEIGLTASAGIGLAIFQLDMLVLKWREMLGLPRYFDNEIQS